MEETTHDANAAQPAKFSRYRSVRYPQKRNSPKGTAPQDSSDAQAILTRSKVTDAKEGKGRYERQPLSTGTLSQFPDQRTHRIRNDNNPPRHRSAQGGGPATDQRSRLGSQEIDRSLVKDPRLQKPVVDPSANRENAHQHYDLRTAPSSRKQIIPSPNLIRGDHSINQAEVSTAQNSALSSLNSRAVGIKSKRDAGRAKLGQSQPESGLGDTQSKGSEELSRVDAPLSAVNAGERNVTVLFTDTSIRLPIIPTTSAKDIVSSALRVFDSDLDYSTITLLEAYKPLRLERPIRHYERIRDIMNNWDSDDQNTLKMAEAINAAEIAMLDSRSVSASTPGEISVTMHYSNRPGSWDKRWITLRSNGQILIAQDARDAAKHACHLRDYDIYTPTPKQIKILHPPRKICYAIKSQHKSAMFLDTSNYVHFFATKDAQIAAAWYNAVQGWRSWHLVNTFGYGSSSETGPTATKRNQRQANTSSSITNRQDRHGIPLPATNPALVLFPDRMTTGRAKARGSSPVAFPNKLRKDATTGSPITRLRQPEIVQHEATSAEPEPFLSTGLLGAVYHRRQKQLLLAEEGNIFIVASSTHPAHVLPSSSQPIARSASVRMKPPLDQPLPRSISVKAKPPINNDLVAGLPHRDKPKPLIDLTPHRLEAPQHIKKESVMPEHLPPGGLIEIATSPDKGTAIPISATWPRPQSSSGKDTTGFPSTPPKTGHHSRPSIDSDDAFTGGGLLARAATQRRAKAQQQPVEGPYLDTHVSSEYVPGSLLAGAQAQSPPKGPVIDRMKRVEVLTKTGEVR
ncbi:hypothetical protein MMC25_008125 [Agyrium rufum]|nr:hypothetical protein [Agyrium rufum]